MKKLRLKQTLTGAVVFVVCLMHIFFVGYIVFRMRFPRPHLGVVSESRLEPSLVYAVIKAESGFCETARSRVGAIGLMQLMPSTAIFVCEMEGIPFRLEDLDRGEYNIKIGCLYLTYLIDKFSCKNTALAAYNAGEGTVGAWLSDERYSIDRVNLIEIPYAETAQYVKKVEKFQKIYRFLYH